MGGLRVFTAASTYLWSAFEPPLLSPFFSSG
jgi:hypothetical protein